MDKESSWLLADKYNGIESDEFRKDILLLKSGVPLAYVIGWTPFLNIKIWLDTKPLIPRPETEFWVEKVIKEIKSGSKILDLCAGSGCIGISILKHVPESIVHFAEIVDDHHQTIRKNIRENGIDVERTKQIGGNLFEYVNDKYDFILTNPPYIDPKLKRTDENVLAHEPHTALFGGANGMEIIEKIIREAPQFLNPNGVLYIEHEPEQVQNIKALAPNAEVFEDQFGIKRYSKVSY